MKINNQVLSELFNKPKIIGLIANTNEGKSMLIYNMIKMLGKMNAEMCSFGLRTQIEGVEEFYSISELEEMSNKIIFIDEFYSLFDLENRKKSREIENILRLINHRNNILVLCGTPDNFKKFISNKLEAIIFKKSTLGDFINGSSVKRICLSYKGYELGIDSLNVEKNSFVLFDGKYRKFSFDYLKEYDTKLKNKPLLNNVRKKCAEILCENVPNKVETFIEHPVNLDLIEDIYSKVNEGEVKNGNNGTKAVK